MSGFSKASGARISRKDSRNKKGAKEKKISTMEAGGGNCTTNVPSNRAEEGRGLKLEALHARIEVVPLLAGTEAQDIEILIGSLGLAHHDDRQTANDNGLHLRFGVETNRAAEKILTRHRRAGWKGIPNVHGHKALSLRVVLVKAFAKATPPAAPAPPAKNPHPHAPKANHGGGHGTRIFLVRT